MLDDPLFVRRPRWLQPSARAEQIAPGIAANMQQLRDALAPAQFTLASTRNFTIAAGTYFCTPIIPPLLERLRSDAPNVSLGVVQLREDGTTMLNRGLIDLALDAMQDLPSRFVIEPLFEDYMVWIAARSNPLADEAPDLARTMRHPRVWMVARRPFSTPRTLEDDAVVADHQSIGWDSEPAGNTLQRRMIRRPPPPSSRSCPRHGPKRSTWP